eukprot:9474261-Pyramimonas_sp.AAC.1
MQGLSRGLGKGGAWPLRASFGGEFSCFSCRWHCGRMGPLRRWTMKLAEFQAMSWPSGPRCVI